MPPTIFRSIATVSALATFAGVFAGRVEAERRPRYGGALRIEMSAAVASLDPADWPSDPAQLAAKAKLTGLVFETLVRLDDQGRPQPWLAISWMHDAPRNRWVFTPRTDVTLHNGAKWEPGPIMVPDDRPIDRILADLARPRNAIAVRLPDGTLVGTGPFGVSRWEAGKAVTLTANRSYWRGRPYLDSIEIQMGRMPSQQALDFELGNADAIQVPLTDLRRLEQKRARLAVSAPVVVMALVFDGSRVIAPAAEQAVALSIDRAAIHTVLLQRQGEISAALLPQWLSGYSFVFSAARDVARARQLAAGAPALTLGYDPADALARTVAERIALNASEAGLSIRAVNGGAAADARLKRLRISSLDPQTALEDLAAQLKVAVPAPGTLYGEERILLGGGRVIPLFQLPAAWELSPKVQDWAQDLPGASPAGKPGILPDAWHLDNVWLDTGAEP